MKLDKNEYNYRKQYSNISQEEIFLHSCYFLIANIKNFIYSAYLCAKIKVNKHKNKFLTFMLMELIKDKLISKLNKFRHTESIRRIQIGVVLTYQHSFENLISLINEEINFQNEYFTILQRKVSFAKDSEDILS